MINIRVFKSIFSKKFLSLLISLGYLGSLFALGIDSYKNPNTFEKYLFINSTILLFLFLIFNLGVRLLFNAQAPGRLREINIKGLFPFAALLSTFLTFFDYYTTSNFVYEKLLLNYQQIGMIGIGSLFFSVINADIRFLKKHYQKLLFLSPLGLFFIGIIIRLWPFDVFLVMVREDNIIEYLQFFTLLTASLLALSISYRLLKENKYIAVAYLLGGIALFVVAGDEISWGQRILGIETPASLAQSNVQREITIHNLSTLNDYVGYTYILLGLLGASLWVFTRKLFEKNPGHFLVWFIPHWYLSIYFLLPAIYNIGVAFFYILNYGEWAEPAELFLHLGFLIFILERSIKAGKLKGS